MRAALVTAGVAVALAGQAHAINKCTGKDGKVVYQDAPCDTAAARGERVRVFAGDGVAPAEAPPAAPDSAPAPEPQQPPARAVGMGPKSTDLSDLDRLAAQCLDWYRPLLRDPAGAYFGSPSFVSGTLTMTLYGRNGFGGYVAKSAACEFKAGRLDQDWTKIQAKRAGWR